MVAAESKFKIIEQHEAIAEQWNFHSKENRLHYEQSNDNRMK